MSVQTFKEMFIKSLIMGTYTSQDAMWKSNGFQSIKHFVTVAIRNLPGKEADMCTHALCLGLRSGQRCKI